MATEEDNVRNAVATLWKTERYSDLTIKCQGETWKVHRAIILVQSKPLAAAIDGSFKEATTGEIDLEDDDPEVVGFMLEYLYTGKVSVQLPTFSAPSPAITTSHTTGSIFPAAAKLSLRAGLDATPQPTYTGASLFGGLVPAPSSPFAAQPTTAAPRTSTLFNFATTPASTGTTSPGTTSLASSMAQTATPTSSRLFGGASGPSIFGSSTAVRTGELFGGAKGQTATSSPVFGTSASHVSPIPKSSPDTGSIPASFVESTNPLIILSLLYVLAEKYDIQPLKKIAKDKYESIVHDLWNNPHFVESLKVIYDGTPDTQKPDTFRTLVVSTAAKNVNALLDRGEFAALLTERGDIATAILRESAEQSKVPAMKRCPKNEKHILHRVLAGAVEPHSFRHDMTFECLNCDKEYWI